jgi:alkylated DNA repair dioxygenase AlkB
LITRWSASGWAEVDLFDDTGLERLPIPDAEVYYQPQLALPAPAPALLRQLLDGVPWAEQEITVWGKTHLQPRLMAWYGDAQASYTYSGIRLEPLPFSPLLLDLKERVERACDASFNSVLLNYYRDQRDSMGMHSDDEPELGPEPAIASVSLGEERVFVMKHRYKRELDTVRLALASGSLLLMKGPTQANWRHGINKLQRPCGPRVNLTFRRILP